MMRWRKQYATELERKIDMVRGGWLFVGINIPLAIVVWQYGYTGSTADIWWQASPWLVQILVLGGMLIRRPPMIIGYLVGFFLALLFPIVFAILFLGGCFVAGAISYTTYVLGFKIGSEETLALGLSVSLGGGFIIVVIIISIAIQTWLNKQPWPRPNEWVAPPDIEWDDELPAGKGGDDGA
jgi:hypothetical protein